MPTSDNVTDDTPKRHNITVDQSTFDKVTALAKKFTRGNRTTMAIHLIDSGIPVWNGKQK